jgi:hypothetical protein
MRLKSAIDEYRLLTRRRLRGEEAREASAALDALSEYLVDYEELPTCEDLEPAHLLDFLLDYYPREEEPDEAVADVLLSTALGFAEWLMQRGFRKAASFLRHSEYLRDSLPRVCRLLRVLREHVHQDNLSSSVCVAATSDLAEWTATDDPRQEQLLGVLGSGLERVEDLEALQYDLAEEEHFRVLAVNGTALVLQSREREALGEPPAGPVFIPAEALALARVGDIIHVEIAPSPGGWGLLEVFSVRPGAVL